MGKRPPRAETAADVERLTCAELNLLIVHTETRFKHFSANSARRKDTFERLIWLEAERERLHGIAAPNRRRPKRGSV